MVAGVCWNWSCGFCFFGTPLFFKLRVSSFEKTVSLKKNPKYGAANGDAGRCARAGAGSVHRARFTSGGRHKQVYT
jgi:hypothetical protein